MKFRIGPATRSALALMVLVLAARYEAAADATGIVVPLPAADKVQLDAMLGTGVVGEAVPGAPLGAIDAYLPAKDTSYSYQVIEAGKPANTETHKIEDTTDAAYAPGWRYSIEEVGTHYLKQNADGGAYTVAEENVEYSALLRYTPGQPLIIPGMKPGDRRKSTLKVAVYETLNLKKVTYSGSLDVTYTYVGAYHVTVPAGTYDAALLRWDYSGKVGPATIRDSQYRFLAPKAGMVAMIQIRSISALLIYNDHTKRGKVLVQTP